MLYNVGKNIRGPIAWNRIAMHLFNGSMNVTVARSIYHDILCKHCRKHYREYLDVCNKDTQWIQFFLEIHNDINKEQEKEQRSYERYVKYIFITMDRAKSTV